MSVQRPDQNKSKPKTSHQPLPSSRYNELLRVIEELGKDVKPTYAGSKNAGERLRKGTGTKDVSISCVLNIKFKFFLCRTFKGILHARALVRDCLLETERNARK